MTEILTPRGDDLSPLRASAHPVTRVFCDENGIVCYVRKGYRPLRLNEVDPRRSRKEALRRCVGLLDMIPDEHSFERNLPISVTGEGLTYNQLKVQTHQACLRSREVEAARRSALEEKRRNRRG